MTLYDPMCLIINSLAGLVVWQRHMEGNVLDKQRGQVQQVKQTGCYIQFETLKHNTQILFKDSNFQLLTKCSVYLTQPHLGPQRVVKHELGE